MIRYRVEIVDRASIQISAAHEWWRLNRPDVPDLFLDDLGAALDRLGSSPFSGSPYPVVRPAGVRRVRLRRTGYHAYYTVNEGGISPDHGTRCLARRSRQEPPTPLRRRGCPSGQPSSAARRACRGPECGDRLPGKRRFANTTTLWKALDALVASNCRAALVDGPPVSLDGAFESHHGDAGGAVGLTLSSEGG